MDLDKWERDRERFLQWCLKKPEEEREFIVEMPKKSSPGCHKPLFSNG